MPQLDKYIFLSQILYLTLFFFLIYIYLRRTVIPDFSSLLKYRNRIIYTNQNEIVNYNKIKNINVLTFDKSIQNFLSKLDTINLKLHIFLKKTSLSQVNQVINNVKSLLITNNNSQVLRKIRVEKERLNSL